MAHLDTTIRDMPKGSRWNARRSCACAGEVPSNVVLAEEFLQVFDGYSIGSNDLTQLLLGIDRDSGTGSGGFSAGGHGRTVCTFSVVGALW